jgi:hypothetical protein
MTIIIFFCFAFVSYGCESPSCALREELVFMSLEKECYVKHMHLKWMKWKFQELHEELFLQTSDFLT